MIIVFLYEYKLLKNLQVPYVLPLAALGIELSSFGTDFSEGVVQI